MENKQAPHFGEMNDELLEKITGGADSSDGTTTTPTPRAVAEGLTLNAALTFDPTCSCGGSRGKVAGFGESDWWFMAECGKCKRIGLLMYGSGTYKIVGT